MLDYDSYNIPELTSICLPQNHISSTQWHMFYDQCRPPHAFIWCKKTADRYTENKKSSATQRRFVPFKSNLMVAPQQWTVSVD